jgi:hypothetical protein
MSGRPLALSTLHVALAAAILIPPPLVAQAADSRPRCDGAPVQTIEIQADRPTFKGAFAWWRKFARWLGLHHTTTADGVVRRFVTLDPGQRCTEFRRSETERILRAQPFLADATVTTTPVGDSVLVNVTTVDEVALVAGARLQGAKVRAFSLGTLNFQGAGMHIEGRWEDGRARRDGIGAKVAHYQMFGHPYTMRLEGARHPIGEHYSTGLSHPFYTDLQRIAWHAGYSTSKDHGRLRRPDRVELLQPIDRSMWNVGGVLRFGPPQRLWLVGGMLIGERLIPRDALFRVDSTGEMLTVDTTGMRRYPRYDANHIAGVLGLRALKFSRMRGLDALAAEQDVGTGTQVGTMVGIQPSARSPFRESFASVDAYAAGRSRRSFVGARMEAESRLNLREGSWEHLVSSGRAAWYLVPSPRWTSELSIEGASVWRSVLPFQLELGDRRGGLRGYARSLEAGSHRALARVEQRLDLARYQKTRAALGAAAFTEAGKVWAGDAPFGVTTPVRVSIGAAILAAVPARSQRTIRAELAVPLDRSRGAGPEFRFVVREPARGFWFEPPRVRWARLSSVPEQIFQWP